MDKKYSDNEVRGERSSRPEQVEKQALTLSFTKNAWDKYRQLTGSQKTFIDRELDDLKFNQNRQKSKMVNAELDQALVFEKNDAEIVITDIVYEPYRESQEHKKAQIRMEDMNN
ncbi:hypothetical protein [Lactobacillus helveticus]|uniref:hypothetical protein n=1 Tax=Lactobacillus helveticus TaxID=1587 RepID=UPI000D7BDE4B|nr:hypothetical protein [Lactobacillus helveticus]NRO50260.1 hypothetical protein [Lactobacillus helveticus]NRO63719.1 hypothetical protein [Lactobacillus helveticus]NRO68751.1 hypothetical protein [Lactobacillus helveticus]NRO70984.1 hypothetical protein [Lactobacillus helveticus]PXZ19750.1 hypothetical protein DM474_06785 [Lactobacillus helveticus]